MTDSDSVPRTPEEARIQKLEERMDDMVHVTDLRELIEEWQGTAVMYKRGGAEGKAQGLAEAAKELEELIDE